MLRNLAIAILLVLLVVGGTVLGICYGVHLGLEMLFGKRK